jgi:hypothetical protein
VGRYLGPLPWALFDARRAAFREQKKGASKVETRLPTDRLATVPLYAKGRPANPRHCLISSRCSDQTANSYAQVFNSFVAIQKRQFEATPWGLLGLITGVKDALSDAILNGIASNALITEIEVTDH